VGSNHRCDGCCDGRGRPAYCKLHGLRMQNAAIFSHVPLASDDGSNVAKNQGGKRFTGAYPPATKGQGALVLVDRIEHHACAVRWSGYKSAERNLELVG
jgi:hypothetical protein